MERAHWKIVYKWNSVNKLGYKGVSKIELPPRTKFIFWDKNVKLLHRKKNLRKPQLYELISVAAATWLVSFSKPHRGIYRHRRPLEGFVCILHIFPFARAPKMKNTWTKKPLEKPDILENQFIKAEAKSVQIHSSAARDSSPSRSGKGLSLMCPITHIHTGGTA